VVRKKRPALADILAFSRVRLALVEAGSLLA
jgi:hypothetical protein